MNNRFLLILASIVVAIVAGAVFFLNMTPSTAPVAKFTAPPTPSPALESSLEAGPRFAQELPRPSRPAVPEPEATPRPPAQPIQPWEQKLEEVLNSTADEPQTAQILINLFPGLPPEGQSEYAEHIANLLDDKDYAKVMPIIKNPNISEEALDVLVTDLVNREDATKLPALLEIAKIPNHPHRQEALDDLELFLDEDHGTDWNKWQTGLTDYLKKQAAEEAEDNALPAAVPRLPAPAGALQPPSGPPATPNLPGLPGNLPLTQ